MSATVSDSDADEIIARIRANLAPTKETTMTPDQVELRLQCLQLARRDQPASDVVSDAEEFYAFISGEVSQTPRQVIDAALDSSGVK